MIKELLQEGFILKSKGKYKHAIEFFYKALEIDDTSSELMLEIAECYYFMGDIERALNYIEQSLQKNPAHIGSLKLLKQIFMGNKAWKDAEQTAKNIYYVSGNPNDLAEIFSLLNKQGKFQELFEYQISENNAAILYELAYAKFLLNDFEAAEKYINRSLDAEYSKKSILLKGKILFKMNRLDECIELLKTVKIDEEDAEMLNFAGLVEQYKCNYSESINYLLKAVRLQPQNDLYNYDCASTYFKMGNIQQAKKYYNLAITINPENKNYHFALANLYYSEKYYKRAMEELNYDFFEANLLKAIILYDSGYIALAKKEFKKLSAEQPENELIKTYQLKIEENLKI